MNHPSDGTNAAITFEELAACLRRAVGAPTSLELTPAMHVDEIPGWDSLAVVRSVVYAEEEFGAVLSASDFASCESLQDIFVFLVNSVSS